MQLEGGLKGLNVCLVQMEAPVYQGFTGVFGAIRSRHFETPSPY